MCVCVVWGFGLFGGIYLGVGFLFGGGMVCLLSFVGLVGLFLLVLAMTDVLWKLNIPLAKQSLEYLQDVTLYFGEPNKVCTQALLPAQNLTAFL